MAPDRRRRGYDPRLESAIVGLSPTIYLPMQNAGDDNPRNLGTGAAAMSLGAGALGGSYAWSYRRFMVNGSKAIDTNAAAISFSRLGLTADQTRLAWVRTLSADASSTYSGNPALCITGDTSGSVWDGWGIHDGKARFCRFNNSVFQQIDSARSVNDGATHMIATTYNSSTRAVEMYVDGEDDGGGTITAHQAQGGVDRIFVGQGSNDPFIGQIAHIAVWSSVLTPAQIRYLWDLSRAVA